MINLLTESEVRERLRAAMVEAGGLRAFARAHGISPAYLSRCARNEMPIGAKIEAALGLERQPLRWALTVKRTGGNVSAGCHSTARRSPRDSRTPDTRRSRRPKRAPEAP